jgi:hypothetical protein
MAALRALRGESSRVARTLGDAELGEDVAGGLHRKKAHTKQIKTAAPAVAIPTS